MDDIKKTQEIIDRKAEEMRSKPKICEAGVETAGRGYIACPWREVAVVNDIEGCPNDPKVCILYQIYKNTFR